MWCKIFFRGIAGNKNIIIFKKNKYLELRYMVFFIMRFVVPLSFQIYSLARIWQEFSPNSKKQTLKTH
jgi:hypothetical protein